MGLGIQVGFFCLGVALTTMVGGLAALLFGSSFHVTSALAAFPYVAIFSFLLAGLCLLTSWVGFVIAQRFKRHPTRAESLVIGCGFGIIPVVILAFVDGAFLHRFASPIILGLVILAAPAALLGSLLRASRNK
jgi:hypothetical protein